MIFAQTTSLRDRLEKAYSSGWFAWLVLAIGCFLRIEQYIINRSLWLDEASLSLNIVGRTFKNLLAPLDYDQGAPVGFLFLEKLFVLTFGSNEYALRLLPLISGLVAIALFYKVSKIYIGNKAAPLALIMFTICYRLIYYSSEVKQYSTDVLAAMLLYMAAGPFFSEMKSNRPYYLFGFLGALSLWFSHIAVFVLAGLGSIIFIMQFRRNGWHNQTKLMSMILFWSLNFALLYHVSLSHLSNNDTLLNYWIDHFAPFPPKNLSDVKWYLEHFYFGTFSYFFGTETSALASFFFLIGICYAITEKDFKLIAAISPVLFLLAASALHRYPYGNRLILFLAVPIFLITSKGALNIVSNYSGNMIVLSIAVSLGLLYYPSYYVLLRTLTPIQREETRPLIEYIRQNINDGDIIYVYYGAVRPFKFYARQYHLDDHSWIEGSYAVRKDPDAVSSEIHKIKGQSRVWLLFSHVYKKNNIDEEKLFLHHLDAIGNCLDSRHMPGASVYLYNLEIPPKSISHNSAPDWFVPIHKWPICPISALREKFNPRNINHMPVEDPEPPTGAVKFFAAVSLTNFRGHQSMPVHFWMGTSYNPSQKRITDRHPRKNFFDGVGVSFEGRVAVHR